MAPSLLTAIGVAALVVSFAAFIARYVPSMTRAVLGTAALSPYLMLGAPAATVLFAALRSIPLAAVAGALTIAVIAVQAPRYVGGTSTTGIHVRVMSANLRYGRADPDALVALVLEHADILAVQELTPEKAGLLSASGLDEAFPYRALRACEGPAGVGVWSRYPIDGIDVDDRFWLGFLTAQVRVPGIEASTAVVATHMSAPWPEPIQGWRDDLARLRTTLEELESATAGPVIVAGDLNATPDVLELRRVLRGGYNDAAEQAGAGLTRTHPADVRLLPPLFAVDHILICGATAVTARTFAIPESDHRALLAEIVLQRSQPTSSKPSTSSLDLPG
ncbi:endonuclease/exonuclease/phosphatase family protein [Mycobacterium sp.]|uniref:endonuclease/exonuclease/phosphatase family protein n=1 Tax=Mycobacterium sp. TaxID=1785 RepID=UPI002D8FE057|nr:endonuclease/exonuclease/phosphatase family protein [Mycobacterium sp.]